jgi:hypothetical protein
MREKVRERGREDGKHGTGKHGAGKIHRNTNPEVIGYRNQIDRTTSFFITNFPVDTNASDLWNLFSKYWKVGEVYIPNRLDRSGKRFGFARFEDVDDRERLLEKLENTWIGTYKLRANLPKFRRGETANNTNSKSGGKNVGLGREAAKEVRVGVSFKEIVQGATNGTSKKQQGWKAKPSFKQKGRLTDEEYRAGIMAIDAEPQNLKKLEGSYVGTLRDIKDVDSIQMTMWMEGFQQIKATPLGLDLILLTCPSIDEIQKAYTSNKQWWERWFSTVRPWRPDILPKGRRTWVRLFGVPLHIWSLEGFKKIVWRYGTLLNLDPETLEQSRLDVARAQIAITYWEMVDEVIEVKVDEELFIIRMVEERLGCVDLGLNKVSGSKNGVGELVVDSDSRLGDGGSVLGVEEGWSEKNSDGADSVNNEVVGFESAGELVGKDWGVVEQAVRTDLQEDRESGSQKVKEKEDTKGYGAEVEEVDCDLVGRERDVCGSGCSRVMETPNPRVIVHNLGSQGIELGEEVGDKELEVCTEENNSLVNQKEGGGVWVQREGKEVIVWEDHHKLILKGSTSARVPHVVGRGLPLLVEENTEVRILKDMEVALLNEELFLSLQREKLKKGKEGRCNKRPLFFGPNKWAQFANANKSTGSKKKKQKKSKGGNSKKQRKGARSSLASEEDSIRDDDSETSAVSSNGCVQQMIPVSNIQVVLNEGEVNRRYDGNMREIRVEAERLFHIGLNLGITSNEERLDMLDRMVDLEVRDEKNFESDGGDDEVQ